MTRQPFEVAAAYALGVLLPVAETIRRRTNFDDIPAYIDDFLIGALLLVAARAAAQQRPHGRCLLAGAWGVLCGGMYYSVFGQIASTEARDVSGFSHGFVIAAKLAAFAVAVAGFVLAIRRAEPSARP